MAIFDSVLERERRYIDHGPQPTVEVDRRDFGLALSGGGIRSATVGLGAIQALAKARLLAALDYVSGVSGGGYVLAWLVGWTSRCGSVNAVQESLRTARPEPKQVSNLRAYSNYLTPNLDLLGADPWNLVATYSINLLNNILITFLLLACVIVLPVLYVHFILQAELVPHVLGFACAALAIIVTGILAYSLQTCTSQPRRRFKNQVVSDAILHCSYYLFWLLLCQGILSQTSDYSTLNRHALGDTISFLASKDNDLPFFLAASALLAFALLGHKRIVEILQWLIERLPYGRRVLRLLFAALCVLALGTLGLPTVYHLIRWVSEYEWNQIFILTCGPLIGLVFMTGLFAIVLFSLGKTTRGDAAKEWISYVLGRHMVAVIIGVSLTVLALLSPYLSYSSAIYSFALLGLALSSVAATWWHVHRILRKGRKAHNLIFSALLFALGLSFFALVSSAAFTLVRGDQTGVDYWCALEYVYTLPAANYWSLCVLLLLLFSYRIGNNGFSMNSFYKNRLVKCYLGASYTDEVDPIAGKQPSPNDIQLNLLVDEAYDGPYPLFNCTMSLFAGEELSWQERKGQSFILTPFFAGFERLSGIGGYRPTAELMSTWDEPLSVGDAITLSGAALSPYMGQLTSRPAAFLMSILNLRLGRWLPNPSVASSSLYPRNRLVTLLRELFGRTDATTDHVYVTDGGHFENLGIYELIRRRCHTIVAIDSSEDLGSSFFELSSALEKARVDHGVNIRIDISPLRSNPPTACWVKGAIEYSDIPEQAEGVLYYIKPLLTGREPLDVELYATTDSSFPHTSTGNQWFSESRFEAYRALGEHMMSELLEQCLEEIRSSVDK